jgi:hypothetical protein
VVGDGGQDFFLGGIHFLAEGEDGEDFARPEKRFLVRTAPMAPTMVVMMAVQVWVEPLDEPEGIWESNISLTEGN